MVVVMCGSVLEGDNLREEWMGSPEDVAYVRRLLETGSLVLAPDRDPSISINVAGCHEAHLRYYKEWYG